MILVLSSHSTVLHIIKETNTFSAADETIHRCMETRTLSAGEERFYFSAGDERVQNVRSYDPLSGFNLRLTIGFNNRNQIYTTLRHNNEKR